MSHFSGLVVRTGTMERSVGSENKELRRVVAGNYEVIFKIIIKNKNFKVLLLNSALTKMSKSQLHRRMMPGKNGGFLFVEYRVSS